MPRCLRIASCALVALTCGCEQSDSAAGSGTDQSATASGGTQDPMIHYASAVMMPLKGQTVSGTAKFDDGVKGTIGFRAAIQNCTPPKSKSERSQYVVVLYEGKSCSDPDSLSEWSRNKNNVVDCDVGQTSGEYFEVVDVPQDKVWTIGGPADSNLVGHAIGIQGPDPISSGVYPNIACGIIHMDDAP